MRHPFAKNWLATANIKIKICQKQNIFYKVFKQIARGKQSFKFI